MTIPYKADVIELPDQGLTLVFTPVDLTFRVTDREAFDEWVTPYVAPYEGQETWSDRDALYALFDDLRGNHEATYFEDIADQHLQLGWLTSADAIYHYGFETVYVHEDYAIHGILTELLDYAFDEDWTEEDIADFRAQNGTVDVYTIPGFELEEEWLDENLTDAARENFHGRLSDADYFLVYASLFGGKE